MLWKTLRIELILLRNSRLALTGLMFYGLYLILCLLDALHILPLDNISLTCLLAAVFCLFIALYTAGSGHGFLPYCLALLTFPRKYQVVARYGLFGVLILFHIPFSALGNYGTFALFSLLMLTALLAVCLPLEYCMAENQAVTAITVLFVLISLGDYLLYPRIETGIQSLPVWLWLLGCLAVYGLSLALSLWAYGRRDIG